MFQVGVARGKAEKLLAMEEEEEGSCKQEEFYSIEESEGEGVGGGEEGKAAAIALRNEGEGRRPEGLHLTSGCNVPQLCFCARRRNRHLDSFLVLLLASYRY
jgi:hypothetical protein